MSYVLKGADGLFRAIEDAVRTTWKWDRAQSFPTEQAAADFKKANPALLRDFAIVPLKEEK